MNTWYEQAIFYHIYPLGLLGAPRENRPEAAGNGEAAEVSGLSRLEAWIPHMKGLHCTALYIGPLFESSTHGYDTCDYRKIDRRLGTDEDFARFVRLCHESGIRVVVDGVFNHTGREFFAFRDIREKRWDSPYKDWYRGVNFDWQSPLGDPFGYEAWQGHFELPCLNLWNPAVRSYLFETIRFWVSRFDIDGIRLDCANVLDFGFMKELRRETAAIKPDFWLMGEVIHGEYSRWVNPEMLHSVTNYELHKAFYSAHNDHNYFEIAHNVRRLETVGKSLYTFVDNHDEDRIASKLREPAHLYPVYQLLFTLPGIPSVYYGSEWGIEGRRTNTSDAALRPALSLAEMERGSQKLTRYIGALANIHKELPAFHAGAYRELLLTNRQYAFLRENGDCRVVCAVNNDGQPAMVSIPVPVPARYARLLLSSETDKPQAECETAGGQAADSPADHTAVHAADAGAAPTNSDKQIPVENGRLSITLPANGGAIYRLVEE